jgi:tetratricopeptide (TPR) repeat protein
LTSLGPFCCNQPALLMNHRYRSTGSALMALLFLGGAAALGYARWTAPIAAADGAVSRGQYEQALAGYTTAEASFDRNPVTKQFFAADYQRVVANELGILYRLDRFDETIDKAERAPEGAMPHFWAGCAYFQKARAEEQTDARVAWMSRAEEELRRAVEAAPADWDAKFDFELTTRLAAEMRKRPQTPPKQLMQLLRPQPDAAAAPPKRVG